MKKWAPVIIALLLITGAFAAYAKIPQFRGALQNAIPLLQPAASPTPDPRADENYDPADEKRKLHDEANDDNATRDEVLYGETYIDDGRVTINKNGFEPAELKVKKGATVIWTNADSVQHTIVVDNGASTPAIPAKREAAITFQKAGTYSYYDKNNPDLKATVIVE